MTGVDDLEPQEPDVEAAQSSDSEELESDGVQDAGIEPQSVEREAELGAEAVGSNALDSVVPKTSAVVPTPIPILDRPPVIPRAKSSVKNLNELYEDADAPEPSETQNLNDIAEPDDTHVIERVAEPIAQASTAIDATEVIGSAEVPVAIETPHEPVSANAPVTPKSGGEELSSATDSTPSSNLQPTKVLPVAVTRAGATPNLQEAHAAPGEEQGDTSVPFSEFEEEKTGRGWVKALVATVATVAVLGGAYAGAQYMLADNIAKGITVAGVDIGGMTEPAAAQRLDEQLGAKLDEEMSIQAGELQTSIVPKKSGVALDAEATVSGLTGFSWSPARLWEHVAGGSQVEPVLTIDETTFAEALKSIETALYVEPVNGSVAFVDGNAVATKAEQGMAVSAESARAVVTSELFTSTRPVVVKPEEVAPEITQEATDEALATAQKIASAAVTVKVAGQSAEIPQEAFTNDIDISFDKGTAAFVFNGPKLVKEVVKRTTDLLQESKDAKFIFVDGKPQIDPGKAGTTLDPDALAEDFAKAASSDNRVVEAELVESDPEQSVEKLESMGIKELVAHVKTPITNEYIRTKNLKVAASRITGLLIEPGQQFNLVKAVGPITIENGYFAAGVIVNGVHTDGVGGGLSQVATTTYNAGFFAGMTDIEHRPHSVWFTRYPEGREATIYVGSIDMIWQNDSDKGVLLRSYVADGQFHVEVWGTKTYKVETTTSPRRNVTPAKMTESTASDCKYYPVGHPGFTVTVTRKVTELSTGEVVKDEANTWTYRPDNGVTCKKKETPASNNSGGRGDSDN